jgi:hypothetical protein
MPDIKPFRAFVYGDKYRKNIGRLVCPPYDVISPQGGTRLSKKTPAKFCSGGTPHRRSGRPVLGGRSTLERVERARRFAAVANPSVLRL